MSNLPELQELLVDIDSRLEQATAASAHFELDATEEREETVRYILVEIDGLHVALSIENLSGVGPLPAITFLPNLPRWIQGIVNIRSEVISVVDFANFLTSEKNRSCTGNRLVVLRYKKRKVGIRIDRIIGAVNRPLSEAKPFDVSERGAVDTSLFTAGLLVDDEFFYILHIPRLLTSPRLVNFNTNTP